MRRRNVGIRVGVAIAVLTGIALFHAVAGSNSRSPADQRMATWLRVDSPAVRYERAVSVDLNDWVSNAKSAFKKPDAAAFRQLVQQGGAICAAMQRTVANRAPSLPPEQPILGEWEHWRGDVQAFDARCTSLTTISGKAALGRALLRLLGSYSSALNEEAAMSRSENAMAKRLGIILIT
jgi:hypothetical protein